MAGVVWRRLRSCAAFLALMMSLGWPSPVRAVWEPPDAGWEQVRTGPLVVHFRPAARPTAQRLAQMGPEAVDRIVRATGFEAPRRMDVVLASDQRTFVRLQPSPPPNWAAGTAWSDHSTLYLRLDLPRRGVNPLPQVYVHELCHLIVGSGFGEASPPRWLSEGLARLLAGELDPEDHVLLSRAAMTGTMLSLRELTSSWPRQAGRAHLAYAQSVHFTIFLNRQGEGVLPKLLAELRAGRSTEDALQLATGLGLAELEATWHSRMTWGHVYIPVLGSSGAFWGLASLLFLFASWKRRREFRIQLARMAERERLAGDRTPAWSQASSASNNASIRPSPMLSRLERTRTPDDDDA